MLNPTPTRLAIRTFVLTLLLLTPATAQDWRIEVFHFKEKYTNCLAIANDRVYVDFLARHAWNVGRIRFDDHEVGQISGATGAVFQWEWSNPLLKPDDVHWHRLATQFVDDKPDTTPNLDTIIRQRLGDDLWNQFVKAAAADKKQAHTLIDQPAAIEAINKLIRDPDLFTADLVQQVRQLVARSYHASYAMRHFNELQKELKDNDGAYTQSIGRHNRHILEYTYPGAFAPLMAAIGTGHGGEVVHELILAFGDKQAHLVRDDRVQYKLGETWSGETVKLIKRSTIGPFDLHATFTFPKDGHAYTVTNHFTTNKDIAHGTFKGYMYTFMHMMPIAFQDFLVIHGDGSEWTDHAELHEEKQRLMLNAQWKSLIVYNQTLGIGIVYAYPEAYEGSNHIYARKSEDKKWRAMLAKRDGWQVGEKLQLQMTVTPFQATPDQWQTLGRMIANRQ